MKVESSLDESSTVLMWGQTLSPPYALEIYHPSPTNKVGEIFLNKSISLESSDTKTLKGRVREKFGRNLCVCVCALLATGYMRLNNINDSISYKWRAKTNTPICLTR